jgi:nickel-dependent lactate racemase
MANGKTGAGSRLNLREAIRMLTRELPDSLVAGRKILVLTPDGTRTCPLPMLVQALGRTLGPRARQLDFMVALGSHPVLDEAQVMRLYGLSPELRSELFPRSRFLCHRWDLPETLVPLGVIPGAEIEELSGGIFREPVAVEINRLIFDCELLLLLGPVFPHEIAGFSGGNKYLFPGISGGSFLHFTHWLGAVITCWQTIGRKDTPVRRLLDRAAGLVPVPRLGISLAVGRDGELAGMFAGVTEEAWARAAELAERLHVVHTGRTYHTVLGLAPAMYDELWVGGKVMYKLEQVVADGGRLIILAPQIRELSRTWGAELQRIGYHVRDYFLRQWERYRDVPWAVLAHSSHVKGLGSFEGGVEKPRIEVILATGIPEELCRRVNLGYLDPAEIRPEEYRRLEPEGILLVERAGETLYRVAINTANE